MKKITIAFFILMLLLQGSIKTAIVTYYNINKEYISANLCENKANKTMQCNGKCYLTKKIKAQENQEKHIPSVLKGFEEILLFCAVDEITFPSFSLQPLNFLNIAYLAKSYQSPAFAIFQPPQ